jgi:hypothetical protein
VHERGVAVGQRNRDSGGNDSALSRSELHVYRCEQVGARVTRMGSHGQREARIQSLDEDIDAIRIPAHA